MSVTHVAAALADGGSIAHFRYAGRYKKDVWLIIDECSYNSAQMWGWLSRFKMVGCKFLILGDVDGQLLPITAGTDDFDYDKLADSDFMHDLCNGLRIDLTEYRRGKDQEHFKFMHSSTIGSGPSNNALRRQRGSTSDPRESLITSWFCPMGIGCS